MQHEKPFGYADWICRFINETMPEVVLEIILNRDNEMIDEKELTVAWISSSEMLADGVTKALPTETFRKH